MYIRLVFSVAATAGYFLFTFVQCGTCACSSRC